MFAADFPPLYEVNQVLRQKRHSCADLDPADLVIGYQAING
jgi:hypothetical protein